MPLLGAFSQCLGDMPVSPLPGVMASSKTRGGGEVGAGGRGVEGVAVGLTTITTFYVMITSPTLMDDDYTAPGARRRSAAVVQRSSNVATLGCDDPRIPTDVRFYNGAVSLDHFSHRRHVSHRLLTFACVRDASLRVLGGTGHCFPVMRPVLGRGKVPSSFGCLVMVRDGVGPATHSSTKTTKL